MQQLLTEAFTLWLWETDKTPYKDWPDEVKELKKQKMLKNALIAKQQMKKLN